MGKWLLLSDQHFSGLAAEVVGDLLDEHVTPSTLQTDVADLDDNLLFNRRIVDGMALACKFCRRRSEPWRKRARHGVPCPAAVAVSWLSTQSASAKLKPLPPVQVGRLPNAR